MVKTMAVGLSPLSFPAQAFLLPSLSQFFFHTCYLPWHILPLPFLQILSLFAYQHGHKMRKKGLFIKFRINSQKVKQFLE